MKKLLNGFASLNIIMGILLLIIPVAFLTITGLDNKPISADNQNTEILSEEVVDPNYKPDVPDEKVTKAESIKIPRTEAVTYGNKVSIPSIGTDASIYECKTSVCGLQKGVWRFPTFGTPISNDAPIVLAAHRWGYDNYSTAYRTKNLFYALDKVQKNAIVKLNWGGKTYTYKVIAKEEGAYITKNTDLILVTCKYFNSPIRIIVYAKLVK